MFGPVSFNSANSGHTAILFVCSGKLKLYLSYDKICLITANIRYPTHREAAIKISVIIPSYNRAKLLARALDSVLQQTRPVDEIVVVDDGSTDETRALLEEQYPMVNYFFQSNRGVSAARNTGIEQSSGNWIALLDSDDSWAKTKLEEQCQAISAMPEYRICHTEEIWIRNGVRVNQMQKHKKYGGQIFQKCLPLCVISPSSVLIARSVFRQAGLFDESYRACEDYELWLRLCASRPVLFVETPLTNKYGGHDDQLSRKYWGMDRFRVSALDKTIRELQLAEADKVAAISMLLSKVEILKTGAIKHNNKELLRYCEQMQSSYREQNGIVA